MARELVVTFVAGADLRCCSKRWRWSVHKAHHVIKISLVRPWLVEGMETHDSTLNCWFVYWELRDIRDQTAGFETHECIC